MVEEALLARLGLAVGDALTIGDATLTVTGVVRKEPDRAASLFTLGPRVLLNAASLDATGLVRLGSRVRHRTLVRLPAAIEPRAARAALVEAMADPAVRVATFDEAQPGLRRFFDQLTTYLRLVGLTSLLRRRHRRRGRGARVPRAEGRDDRHPPLPRARARGR